MGVVAIIEEAWEHHRRRYRSRSILALVTCVIAAAGVWLGRGSGSSSSPSGPSVALVPASEVLARAPYMGVRCGVPNWIGCDRVGLAVWLKRPAMAVDATIAGGSVRLDEHAVMGRTALPRRVFNGDLAHAGITSRLHVRPAPGARQKWYGAGQPSPVVQLTIHYADGHAASTRLRVALAPGWG